MSTNCVFETLAPGGVDCSGNGVCINTTATSGTCRCDEGWSGVGDFTFVSEDCVSIALFFSFLLSLSSLPFAEAQR